MRATRWSTLALALALAAPPLRAQLSRDTSFGTWPYLVGNMDPQIPGVVGDAVRHGLDTIYVSVFRATGPSTGTLWITDAPGTWNRAWGPVRTGGAGIDLVELIRQARAANLQVVGVLKCFDATAQPSSASHRAYLLAVMNYLLNTFDAAGRPVYDLDGLALDYIRWVGASCSTPDPRVVTDFLREVRGLLGVRSLHAYLIANRYTFDGPVYNGQFNSYSAVTATLRSCYGQDWEQMCRYVDVMMPMAYTANGSIYSTYALHKAYVQVVAAYCRQAVQRGGFAATRVTPAVKTYGGGGETTTAQTVDASIAGALAGGAEGYQAFRYATIQSSWWPVLGQYAAPGANRPVADLAASHVGLTTHLDAAGSSSSTQPSWLMQARFDWDNDGSFETGWLPNLPAGLVARSPGVARAGVQVKDLNDHIAATVRQFTVPGALSVNGYFLSASAGVNLGIDIDAGPAAAGQPYVVLGTISGSSPGTIVGSGLVLPLNVDAVTLALIQLLNTPVLANGAGLLDARGRATATFFVPPLVLSPLAPVRFDWAAAGGASVEWVTENRGVLVFD